MARMNGDFEEDDLSDISDDEENGNKRKRKGNKDGRDSKKKKKSDHTNPEEMDSDDNDDNNGKGGEEEHEVRFTADGLMYIDKQGKVVGKVGDEKKPTEVADSEEEDSDDDAEGDGDETSSEAEEEASESEHDLGGSDGEASAANSDDESEDNVEFTTGTKVQGNYRAKDQYKGKENWFNGEITAVREDSNGNKVYDITYEDGDFEEGVIQKNVRSLPKSKEEKEKEEAKMTDVAMAKAKKLKAKIRARLVVFSLIVYDRDCLWMFCCIGFSIVSYWWDHFQTCPTIRVVL